MIPEEHRAAIAHSLFEAQGVTLAGQGLTQTTVYFMHYFFEACRELGRMDAFFERMKIWYEMVDYDFKTTYESGNPHDVRSDCHAWGSHPCSIILPRCWASALRRRGSKAWRSCRSLGRWKGPAARWCTRTGEIRADFHVEGGSLHGSVELPAGVVGTLQANGQVHALAGGRFEF